MAGELCERHRLLADAAQRELVEHAGGAVRLDQPVDREQGGEQGRHPQSAAAGAGEERGVRTDGEGEERRDEQKEEQRQGAASAGRGKAQLAEQEEAHPSSTLTAPGSVSG